MDVRESHSRARNSGRRPQERTRGRLVRSFVRQKRLRKGIRGGRTGAEEGKLHIVNVTSGQHACAPSATPLGMFTIGD